MSSPPIYGAGYPNATYNNLQAENLFSNSCITNALGVYTSGTSNLVNFTPVTITTANALQNTENANPIITGLTLTYTRIGNIVYCFMPQFTGTAALTNAGALESSLGGIPAHFLPTDPSGTPTSQQFFISICSASSADGFPQNPAVLTFRADGTLTIEGCLHQPAAAGAPDLTQLDANFVPKIKSAMTFAYSCYVPD